MKNEGLGSLFIGWVSHFVPLRLGLGFRGSQNPKLLLMGICYFEIYENRILSLRATEWIGVGEGCWSLLVSNLSLQLLAPLTLSKCLFGKRFEKNIFYKLITHYISWFVLLRDHGLGRSPRRRNPPRARRASYATKYLRFATLLLDENEFQK